MRYSFHRLRPLREALGYSRETVGRRVNRTAGTIYRYETGELTPTVHVLGDLAECYHVSVGELYDSDREPAAAL